MKSSAFQRLLGWLGFVKQHLSLLLVNLFSFHSDDDDDDDGDGSGGDDDGGGHHHDDEFIIKTITLRDDDDDDDDDDDAATADDDGDDDDDDDDDGKHDVDHKWVKSNTETSNRFLLLSATGTQALFQLSFPFVKILRGFSDSNRFATAPLQLLLVQRNSKTPSQQQQQQQQFVMKQN